MDTHRFLEMASEMDAEVTELKGHLVAERSFRKVYAAASFLMFMYGLVYGVYLSK